MWSICLYLRLTVSGSLGGWHNEYRNQCLNPVIRYYLSCRFSCNFTEQTHTFQFLLHFNTLKNPSGKKRTLSSTFPGKADGKCRPSTCRFETKPLEKLKFVCGEKRKQMQQFKTSRGGLLLFAVCHFYRRPKARPNPARLTEMINGVWLFHERQPYARGHCLPLLHNVNYIKQFIASRVYKQ